MDFLDIVWHLGGVIAPAAGLAVGCVLLAPLLGAKQRRPLTFYAQFAIIFAMGLLILGAGLLYFGRDGKMLTYATLVVGVGVGQWLLLDGWRR